MYTMRNTKLLCWWWPSYYVCICPADPEGHLDEKKEASVLLYWNSRELLKSDFFFPFENIICHSNTTYKWKLPFKQCMPVYPGRQPFEQKESFLSQSFPKHCAGHAGRDRTIDMHNNSRNICYSLLAFDKGVLEHWYSKDIVFVASPLSETISWEATCWDYSYRAHEWNQALCSV